MSIWTAVSGIWQTAANWSGGVPNASGALAEFTNSTASGIMDVTFNAGTVTLTDLTVDVTQNGSVRFGNSGSAATMIFTGPRAGIDIDTNGSSAVSFIGSLVTLQLNTDVSFVIRGSDSQFEVRGDITGTGTLIKTDLGVLELYGDNTYSGGTFLQGGIVELHNSFALGTGTVTFRGGALYENFSALSTLSNPMIVASNFSGSIRAQTGDTLILTIPSFIHQGGGAFEFNSTSSSAFAGTIGLAATSVTNQSGAIYTLAAGTVIFKNAYSAANFFHVPANGRVTLENNATLDTAGHASIVHNLSIFGGDIISSGNTLNLAIVRTGFDVIITTANITGTAGADYLAFYITDNADSKNLNITTVNFANWTDGVDIIGLIGSSLADAITGSTRNDTIIGGGGSDDLFGFTGNDAIFGEEGADTLNGQAGIDYIVGGTGNDIIDGGGDPDEIYGQEGDDSIDGGLGFFTDILVGGDGGDTINGASGNGDFDFLYGNLGDDIFFVDTPADLVFEQAGEGFDTVNANIVGAGFYLYDNIENLTLLGSTPFGVGNGLANGLLGNAQANYLLGGGGNDTLNGAGGNDVLFGEAGADTFVFGTGTGTDIIGDFQLGADKIRLSNFGTALDSFAEIQPFFTQVGTDGAIQLPGGETIIIHSLNIAQLTATDIIFG